MATNKWVVSAAIIFVVVETMARLPGAIAGLTVGMPTPQAIPPYPVSYGTTATGNTPTLVGPGNVGPFAVTSLTLANFGTVAQTVFMTPAASMDGATCASGYQSAAGTQMYYLIPPQQTLHLAFPSPFVVPKVGGVHCLAFQANVSLGTVTVLVNGYHE